MLKPSAFAAFMSCLLLAACSGGGGGGGSSSGGGSSGGGSSSGGSGNTITLNAARVDLYADAPFGTGNTAEVTVTFSGAGVAVGTLPGETLPPWLFIFNPTVVNPTTARVQLSFTQQSSTPQRYSQTLRFATADANGTNIAYRDLLVTGTLDHTLSIEAETLTYTRGATASPVTRVDVQTLNATWVASSDTAWLQVSPASGTGNTPLNLTTTAGSLAEGDYVGTITVRDTVTNRTKATTIYLGVDPRRLETGRRGLAFTSTLGGSRLSRTLRVIDTAGLNGRWTATSDAAWLTSGVASGAGTSTIMLNASAAGLAEGMHYATLTLAPDSEPGFGNSTTVRAGLFIDRTHAIVSPLSFDSELGYTPANCADPIRPYLYTARSGGTNNAIKVWNMYTGALVDTLPLPGGYATIPVISPDGSLLLIPDLSTHNITPVRLLDDTRTVGTPWSGVRASAGIENLAITRVGGAEVVAWGPGQLLSASTGAVLADFGTFRFMSLDTPRFIAASPDGSAAYIAGQSNANHRLMRIALGYRAGIYSARITHDFNEPGDGYPPSVDPTGKYLYSSGDVLTRYDTVTMASQRSVSGIGGGIMDVLENGNVNFGVNRGPYMRLDRDLVELGRDDFGTWLYTGRVSGDERRLFTIVETGASQFRNLPP